MGCVGGAIWYFVKGFYNSPSRERFRGAVYALKNRAPVLGGSFAMWGGMFSIIDCSLLYLRQKESPHNAVAAGFATGGILAIRSGAQLAIRNAFAGAAILGIIETVQVYFTSMQVKHQFLMMETMSELQAENMRRAQAGAPQLTQEEIKQRLQPEPEQKSGMFGGYFSKQ